MNCFSAQRFGRAVKPRLGKLLRLLLIAGTLAPALPAQTSDALYRGTWQLDTPEQGALILIVKRNNRASYFWADNADRTVYQGNWSHDDNAATLTWSDGSSHRIQRDALGFGITYSDPAGDERYTAPGQQLAKEVLGQWAQAPRKADALEAEEDRGKGFFGTWQIGSDADKQFVIIEANRSAATDWNSSDAERGLRGSWAKHGSELHIAWDSGHYSILKQNERDFAYKQIAPGAIIEDDESSWLAATRTRQDNVPNAWLTRYQSEQQHSAGGIAFNSREDALAFYRGAWIVQRDQDTFERIEIGRFGGLSHSGDRSLQGNWRMTGQDIFMRWDDGMRQVLSPIGHGFLLYEYKPGRPLDGVPSRIVSASPVDPAKLAQHLQGRQQVAEQILHRAAAAGIDPKLDSNSWGQTFMRWAWPFSDDQSAATTDELLAQGFEEPTNPDPWWWPFWSEQSTADTAAPNAATASTPTGNAAPPPTPNAASQPTEQPANPAQQSTSKKRWYWPFDL